MADMEIKSLRVSAEMDASKYTAGAAQKVAADKAMVASGNQVAAGVTQQDTKISQAGDVLARLSRQYVDGYASAQRFNSALNQLSTGIERGKITMEQASTVLTGIYQKYGMMGDAARFAARGQTELANAITQANNRLQEQQARFGGGRSSGFSSGPSGVGRITPAGNQNQGGLARFGSLNATSQLQDIAITAAMGQSPLTIALQQGTQLGMAMETQLAGQAAGVGAIFKNIGGALAGLVTSTNLWAIGLTAAAAVAIQFGGKLLGSFKSAEEQARDFNKLLSEQKEILQSLGPIYEEMARQREGTGQFQAPGVGRLVLQQNLEDARKAADEQARDALKEMQGTGGAFLSLFRMLPNGAQNFLGRNESATEFDRIVDMASKSEMSINDARTALQRFGAEHPDFNYIINRFLQMSEAAAKTEREVGGLVGILDKFAAIRLPEAATYPKSAAEEQARADALRSRELAAINRQNSAFNADILGVNARSPEERAAAARAAAAAEEGTGTGAANENRIELAGKRALIEAEQQLKDAQDERKRSLDQTLDSAKLDLELVGKTTAEIEGLRMAAQLESQVREEAARNHVAADEAEIASIRKKAEEIGKLKALEQARTIIKGQQDDLEMQRGEISAVGQNKLAHDALIASLKTEQEIRKLGIDPIGKEAEALRANTEAANANAEALAKANLAADLAFERRQIGRDDQDQAIANRLKSAGLPDDLNSTEAALIRANMRLSEAKDDFKGFFHDVLDGFRQGKSAVEAFTNALSNLAGKIADRFLDRALDELFGKLFGGDSSSSGGSGGGLLDKLFGSLFGGGASTKFPPAPPANDNWLINPSNAGTLGLNPGNYAPGGYPGPMANVIAGGAGANGVTGYSGLDRLFPSAGVTRTGIPLSQIGIDNLTAKVDAQYASRFQGLLDDLKSRGYPISSLGEGGYSFRTIRGPGLGGSHQLSNHAYGDALDINPRQNPFRRGATGNFDEYGIDPGSLARQHGLKWGGEWRTPDTMHFQVDKSLNDLSDSAKTASSSLKGTGLAGFDAIKGLQDAGGGLSKFGSLLSSFMGPGGGSGTGWFQGLSSLFGGAAGAIGHMMSISPGATGAILAGGALGPAGLYHEGGIAGFPSSMRGVHPSVFIGAKRYHMGGLAGDEVPAILRRGEPVFKSMEHARQMFAPANQNIDYGMLMKTIAKGFTLKNINVYDPSVVGDYTRTDDGEQAFINMQRRTGTARGL